MFERVEFKILIYALGGSSLKCFTNPMNYDRISIVVNRSILTTILLRIKGTSCLILPHFANCVVFGMKDLVPENLAKSRKTRHF